MVQDLEGAAVSSDPEYDFLMALQASQSGCCCRNHKDGKRMPQLPHQQGDFVDGSLAASCRLGLIPESISWEDWVGFVQIVAANLDYQNLHSVNVRYRRGELRLGRVNWIYRLCSQTRHNCGFFRRHHFNYYTYESFVERNLTCMTTVVVYVTLILTAMQVGLAENSLKGDDRLNAASYVFTIFSIVVPLFVVVVVLAVTIFAVLKNWMYVRFAQEAKLGRTHIGPVRALSNVMYYIKTNAILWHVYFLRMCTYYGQKD
jgi:hypothetical protein